MEVAAVGLVLTRATTGVTILNIAVVTIFACCDDGVAAEGRVSLEPAGRIASVIADEVAVLTLFSRVQRAIATDTRLVLTRAAATVTVHGVAVVAVFPHRDDIIIAAGRRSRFGFTRGAASVAVQSVRIIALFAGVQDAIAADAGFALART